MVACYSRKLDDLENVVKVFNYVFKDDVNGVLLSLVKTINSIVVIDIIIYKKRCNIRVLTGSIPTGGCKWIARIILRFIRFKLMMGIVFW